MTGITTLDHITIVLHKPRYSENIGAAVRAGYNMGITHFMVVDPAAYDIEKIRRMATHNLSEAVDGIRVKDDLKEALSGFHYVVGTTARQGKHRKNVGAPHRMAEKVLSLSADNQIALLFGPEDRGLTNEDLQFCNSFVTIPTASFSSLNLSQAVMVLCYELFTRQKAAPPVYTPRLANRHELEGMYSQLQEILIKISFLKPQNPEYWMNNLRTFFSRLELRAKEVSILRGICRQINWYGEKRFRDGLADAEKNKQPPAS